MKNVILLFTVYLLVGCSTAKLVTVPPSENVIEVKGTKTNLYIKANEWMVNIFTSAKSVIQFQDKEEGIIVGKYLMHVYPSVGLLMNFPGLEAYAIIKIQVRDSAAKISIEPQDTWWYGKYGFVNYDYSPEKAKQDIDKLIQDFKDYITTDNKW